MAGIVAKVGVQVEPTMKGFRKTVMAEADSAVSGGGNRLKRGLSKAGGDAGKDFSGAFKKGLNGNDFGKASIEGLERSLGRAKAASAKATRQMEDDKSRLAIANERLKQAEEKYGKESAQARIAAEKVAMAERKAAESKENARVASGKLADAEKALKQAQDEAAKSAEKSQSAFGRLKTALGEAFGKLPGASKLKSLFEPLTQAASGLKDKISGGLSKAWNLLPEGFRNAASRAASSISEHLGQIPGKVGNAFSTMASAAGAALSGLATAAAGAAAAAAAAIAGVVKGAVDEFARYEQLTGGMGKIFGTEDAKTVIANSKKAYKSAGMSANQYMTNATNISATLVSSLGGDTKRAAELVDMAMSDMADNSNTFGRSAEDIAAAYTSLARGNFGMLDNLSLGYSQTKEGMQDLMADASEMWRAAYGEDRSFNAENFADIVEAIHVVQGGLGDATDETNIFGSTMREGATTIEGSLNQTKAAWDNFKTSLGTGEDVAGTFQSFVDSAGTYLGNLIPVVQQIMASLWETIRGQLETWFPGIGEKFDAIKTKFEEIAGYIGPRVAELWAAVQPWLESAWGLIQEIGGAIMSVVGPAIDFIGNALAVVMDALTVLFDFLRPVWDWLMEKVGAVFSFVGEVVGGVIQWAADLLARLRNCFDNIGTALNGLRTIWETFKNGVHAVIQFVIQKVVGFATSVMQGFARIVSNVRSAMSSFRETVSNAITNVANWFRQLPGKIMSAIGNLGSRMFNVGKDMVSGLIRGLGNIASAVYNKIKGGIDSAIGSVKSWLGIGSPSRLMARIIGVPMAQGVAMGFGWETGDMTADIQSDIADATRRLVTVPVSMAGTVAYRATYGGTAGAAGGGVQAGRVVNQTINVQAVDPASVAAVLVERERVALGA